MSDRRAGILAVIVLALALCGLWLAAGDAPTSCIERAPAGIMCTSGPTADR